MNSGDKPRSPPARRKPTVIEIPTVEPAHDPAWQRQYQAGAKRRRSGGDSRSLALVRSRFQPLGSYTPPAGDLARRDEEPVTQRDRRLSGRVKQLERGVMRSREALTLASSTQQRDLPGSRVFPRESEAIRRAGGAYSGSSGHSDSKLTFTGSAKAAAAKVAAEFGRVESVLEIDSDQTSDEGDEHPKSKPQQISAGRDEHAREAGDDTAESAQQKQSAESHKLAPHARQYANLPGMAESVANKVHGFGSTYSPGTLRLNSLIRNTDVASGLSRKEPNGATPAVNSIQHLLKPMERPPNAVKSIVERLQPKHHSDTEDNAAQARAKSPPSTGQFSLISPAGAAGGSFSSAKSRTQMAERYDEILATPPLKRPSRSARRSTLATPVDLRSPSPPPAPRALSPGPKQRRRQTTISRPSTSPVLPNKSINLRGIQIGKYFQQADMGARKPGSPMLKLNILPVQRHLHITGLGDGTEFMRIEVRDIASLEHREHEDIVVLRITPGETMESVFDEKVFDPSSLDTGLSLIYLCWEIRNKSDGEFATKLFAAFKNEFRVSALEKDVYVRYAREFTKPSSIDLISSSEDENSDNEKEKGTAVGNGKQEETDEGARSGIAAAHSAKSRLSGAGGQATTEATSTYWSSIDTLARAAPRTTEDQWKVRNLGSEPKGLGNLLGKNSTASGQRRYGLRKTGVGSMAELPSSSSDSDDDDFVKQKRVFGFNDHSIQFEYPQGDRKPISVTGADICRLYRGEFLNDTVIEFYLRYIAENLRTRNPQLYDQCFFFNTFFFKKLSRRHKGMSAGSSEKLMETVYGQLKKWTANADLFAKKYIFVPINENIHWYLAIIINPELLLSKEPNIDSCDGKSDEGAKDERDEEGSSSGVDANSEKSPETRHALSDYFAVKPGPPGSSKPDAQLDQQMDEAGNADGDVEMSEDLGGGSEADARKPATSAPQTPSPARSSSAKAQSLLDNSRSLSLGSSQPSSCKAISLSPQQPKLVTLVFKGKEVAISEAKYQDPFASSSIIILDSLGSKHQPTFGLLRGYIQSEAKHRRNRDVVESLVGKYAKVPLQNNLCDCGVFLLHYVEEFLDDPETFVKMAMNGVSMRDWFAPELAKQKRKDILALAIRLAEEHAVVQKDKKEADKEESPKSTDTDTDATDPQEPKSAKHEDECDDVDMADAEEGRNEDKKEASSAETPEVPDDAD